MSGGIKRLTSTEIIASSACTTNIPCIRNSPNPIRHAPDPPHSSRPPRSILSDPQGKHLCLSSHKSRTHVGFPTSIARRTDGKCC
ncbi:hypothetical protein ARMGADRAFT_568438 [Armillaria gallica]|uniref:Uncharacterized protein n=1 Tax=Armillaria gallica TaxID=47427 RepID=A0A2H3DSB5_ARMGA|nr:hypothetical protein ARMGADRAFT_568438 [Armillaria gallica]